MFEHEARIPYMGLGPDGHVRAEAFLDIFQEAATLHADSLGCGVADLRASGYTWVLRRYSVSLVSPASRGSASVRTWYAPERNLHSIREFSAHDAAGALCAAGWSAWILLDLERGRPTRLDRGLPKSFFDGADETSPGPADRKLEAKSGADFEAEFKIRRCELDTNGHVNHTVYFTWCFETLPDEAVAGRRPVSLDAEYFRSAQSGKVSCRAVRVADDPLTFAHSISIADTGEEAVRAVTVWGM